VELLKSAARQRLAAGEGVFDPGVEAADPARKGTGSGPLPITASRMNCLPDALGARLADAAPAGRRRGRGVARHGAGPGH
jgi:hypothetical protein